MNRRPAPGAIRALGLLGGVGVAGALLPTVPRRWRLPANVATATMLVLAARRTGTSSRTLGLDRRDLGRGARAGMLAALPVAAVAVGLARAVATTPALGALADDRRVTEVPNARAAYEVLVRIPVETALTEEVLFRGVVLGSASAAWGPEVGIAVSSLAFGVWHVLPAIEAHAHNAAGADLASRVGGRSTHVAATVAATAAAGVAFAALRLRSGSVVAPVLAHAAVNGAGYLAARWVHATRIAAAQP